MNQKIYVFAILIFLICSCGNKEDKNIVSINSSSFITADMRLIPAGKFLMGSDNHTENKIDEQPAHTVYLDAYYIDKFEVTNREYARFIKETGHPVPYIKNKNWAKPFNWENNTYPQGKAEHPVVMVSWNDASEYAKWAGKRLPTEAEWEKAARGGLLNRKYPSGDQIKFSQASYNKGYIREKKLEPVGSYPPNGYNLYDMAGNVWEWCSDWYSDKYYKKSAFSNPEGPDNGTYKVFRGGSWMSDSKYLGCSHRGKNVPEYRSTDIGFRCVLTKNSEN